MIKDEYINTEMLDDNSLLMQYFRKHDADNNNQLDGLELLKALAKMDCKRPSNTHNERCFDTDLQMTMLMTAVMTGVGTLMCLMLAK